MTLAFTFGNWWLLLGVLAAAIPVVLHLLSSVRAPEAYFPTLRFLRISMEKTARRRRLEHWLLLLVRSLLLALLALAVAEPILKAAGGFLVDPRSAAVLIVDNSHSMGVRSGGSSRLDHALRESGKLLGGSQRPSSAALLVTNASGRAEVLQGDLSALRERLAATTLASGRAPVAELLARAADLLERSRAPKKVIYVFSDLQRISFEGLAKLDRLTRAGIPVMLVDCSGKQAANVGISELTITGRRVVDQSLQVAATLVNSSPTARTIEVGLQIDGRSRGEPVRKTLAAAGRPGAKAAVRFPAFRFATPGPHSGQVAIQETDDLAIDNVRRFSLDVAERVPVVLVRGSGQAGDSLDPAAPLQMVLNLLASPVGPEKWPASVQFRTIQAAEFDEEALAAARVVFFADVSGFTPAQAEALERFVRLGGSAGIFLGPKTDAANYNEQLVQRIPDFGGLLPGRIGKAVGMIGQTAPAVRAVKNFQHPYLAGFPTPSESPVILIQRYYALAPGPGGAEAILSTPAGERIVSAKDFGKGRVILFATTATTEWNNLASEEGAGIFLPIIDRICLEAGERLGGDQTYLAGAAVTIRPRGPLPATASIDLMLPDGGVEPLALNPGPQGPQVQFTRTATAGLYRWQVSGADPAAEATWSKGNLAANIDGSESDLAGADAAALAKALEPADLYVGATLEEAHAAAADAAAGDNLWDRLLAVVILLLVVEAAIANRFRRGATPVPAHLNPRLAGGG